MQPTERAVEPTRCLERLQRLHAVQHVRDGRRCGADRRAGVELAGERVALREQRRGECGTLGVAEPLPLDQQPAEPRVNRQPRRGLPDLGEFTAVE